MFGPGGCHKPKKWSIIRPRRERPATSTPGSRSFPPWCCYTCYTDQRAPGRSRTSRCCPDSSYSTCKKMVDSRSHSLLHCLLLWIKIRESTFFYTMALPVIVFSYLGAGDHPSAKGFLTPSPLSTLPPHLTCPLHVDVQQVFNSRWEKCRELKPEKFIVMHGKLIPLPMYMDDPYMLFMPLPRRLPLNKFLPV